MNYSVRFDPKFGYYRARFWDRSTGEDTYAKVPDRFWRELGIDTPTEPDVRYEKLALRWAAGEVAKQEEAAGDRHLRRNVKMTLQEVWELYQAQNPNNVGPETMTRDATNFAAIAKHIAVKRVFPEDIDISDVVSYRNARREDTVRRTVGDSVKDVAVRNRTVNNETALIARLVTFARDWSKLTGCTSTRLAKFKRLVEQDSGQVALSERQLAALFAKAEKVPQWKQDLVIVGIATRLRRENLLGLRADWIDWTEKRLVIPAEFMKKGRADAARELNIPLPEIAIAHLGSPKLRGFVWTNPDSGLPYTKVAGLERWADDAGVPQFSLHDLRTTGNTLLHVHGVDHLTRKALMGHSVRTGDVTDLYTKVIWENMQTAVAIFDQIFKRVLAAPVSNVISIADRA